jgi:hypothetical protein
LKNLLAVILSLALFAPPYAKILLYADCSFKAMMNEDPRFCDCSKIIDVAPYPSTDGQTEKQQNLEQKTDWKYLAQEKFQFQTSLHTTVTSFQTKQNNSIPIQHQGSVFHPPKP